MDVFELKATLSLDTSEYDKGLANAGSKLSSVSKQASVFGDVLKANLASSAITAGIKGVANTVGAIGSAVIGVGKSVADLAITGGMERALNTEQALFKLKGLHMESQQIEEVMKNANDAVLDTAYGLDEMATVAASAVAAGVKPGEELTRTLKLVGDAAAIAGRDVSSMGSIFNKIAASGKIQGDELNQLTDAGIPILQLLGDVLDEDADSVRKLAKDGQIGFDVFQEAIERGMGGAALSMGETFQGNLANMKAAVKRLGQGILEPFLQNMTPALGNIKQLFNAIKKGTTEGVDENISQLHENLSKAVSGLITDVSTTIQNGLPVLTSVVSGMVPLISNTVEQLVPVVMELTPQLLSAGAQIIGAFGQGIVNSGPQILGAVAEIMRQVFFAILDFDWAGAGSQIGQTLATVFDPDNWNAGQSIAYKGFAIVESLIQGMTDALPELIKGAAEFIADFARFLSDDAEDAPHLINAGMNLVAALATGIGQAAPTLIPSVFQSILSEITKILSGDGIENMFNAANDLINGLVDGIVAALPVLVAEAPNILLTLYETMASHYPDVLLMGPRIIGQLVMGIVDSLPQLKEAGLEAIRQLTENFDVNIAPMLEKGKEIIGNIISGISEKFEEIKAAGGQLIDSIKAGIDEKIAALGEAFNNVWNTLMQNPMIAAFVEYIVNTFESMKETLIDVWEGIKETAAGTWELIKNAILGPVLLLIDLVTGDFQHLETDALNIWNNIQNAAVSIWNGMMQILTSISTGIRTQIVLAFTALKDTVIGIWTTTKQNAIETWESIKTTAINAAMNLVTSVREWITQVPIVIKSKFDEAVNYIKDLPGKALQWGKDLISNFVDGIKQGWSDLKSSLSSTASTIRGYLHFSEPDVGPLSDFHTYAPDMMKLFAQGIKDNTNIVTDQMERSFSLPEMSASGATNRVTGGNVTINVYGAEGQSEKKLAEEISNILLHQYNMEHAVWGAT